MDVPCGTPIDTATLRSRLAAAQAAYDALVTGNKPTKVVADGSLVEFQHTKPADLKAYISSLQDQISNRTRVGAIGFRF